MAFNAGKFQSGTTPWKFWPSRDVVPYSPPEEIVFDSPDFLPGKDQGNDQLNRFLSIFEESYAGFRDIAGDLNKLVWYDECPGKYIFRLAQNLGFPLLDSPYASEVERRRFLQNAVWILKRKGTLAAIKKIIEILGFSCIFQEQIQEDFIINRHKFYSIEERTSDEFIDRFNAGVLDGWEKQEPASDWQLISNRYRGIGDGTDKRSNCSIIANNFNSFYLETEFQVLGGSGSNFPYFGVYLNYLDPYMSSFGVFIYSDGGSDFLWITGYKSYIHVIDQVYNITGKVDYKTGKHLLKVIYFQDRISVGIDDTTLINPFLFEGITILWQFSDNKGLFVNQSTQVAFDNFRICKLKETGTPKLAGGDSEKKLKIKLFGDPENADAKKEYVQEVIPKYFVSVGVDVEWLE